MAPGSKKNSKSKSKRALSVDFKRVKSKVGRKLLPAQNATKVEFKSKGIVIPGQSLAQDKDGLALNQRKQTLKELLVQCTHYSDRTRKDALMGLKDLFGKHPKELVMHAVVVVDKISPRITDMQKSVRQALVLLLRSSVLPQLPQTMMKPLVPMIMAHVSSAMTHLVLEIRIAACTFLDLLVQHCPQLLVPFFSGQIIQHYVGLLGKGGISGQPGSRLASVLSSLEHFLSSLQSGTMAQPLEGSQSSSMTHTWGLKRPISEKGVIEDLQALHGYRSALLEGSSLHLSTQEGRFCQILDSSTQLVPVLLECWAEYAPMVCNAPNPDISSLDCMVLVARCLYHVFHTLISENSGSLARNASKKTATMYVPEYGSEEWDSRLSMQQEFLPGLNRHLLSVFPMPAPVVRLPPKVEEGLVALNIGICEVMLQFVLPKSDEMDGSQNDVVLEYFESALYGTMLPSSQFSEGVSNPKLAEPHMKSLIRYLPGLVLCVSSDWVSRLLHAFTHAFESCNSRSSTKMVCLSSMTELVLPGSKSGERKKGRYNLVPSEFQTQWLHSLPKLLWELKHSHSNVSQAVLEMLLYIGRSSLEGSALAEKFTGLQHAMVPFFCTFLPPKQNDESRCLYGPFMKLPKPCQELATDLIYYYSSFSPLFLKVLAQCSLCPDLDSALSVRMVEVLQKAFCRGAIGLTEHLSFLFTLLAGRMPSQAGRATKESPGGIAGVGPIRDNMELELRERHSAFTGIVCACLSQIGDGNLILFLLGPSIREELERQAQLRVLHGFFRVVAVLSQKQTHSDGFVLPDSLADVLPESAADFLVALAEVNNGTRTSRRGPALDTLRRPCIILMARSPSFTLSVLKAIHKSLLKVAHPSIKEAKKRVTFVQVVLELIKMEKLDRSLSSSKDAIKTIMETIEVHEDIHTIEGRDLRRLHEQLLTESSALYGSQFFSNRA